MLTNSMVTFEQLGQSIKVYFLKIIIKIETERVKVLTEILDFSIEIKFRGINIFSGLHLIEK